MLLNASLLSIGGLNPLEVAVLLVMAVSFLGILYLISSDWSLIEWDLLSEDTSRMDRIMTYLVLGIISLGMLSYSFLIRRFLLGIIATGAFLIGYYYFREKGENTKD